MKAWGSQHVKSLNFPFPERHSRRQIRNPGACCSAIHILLNVTETSELRLSPHGSNSTQFSKPAVWLGSPDSQSAYCQWEPSNQMKRLVCAGNTRGISNRPSGVTGRVQTLALWSYAAFLLLLNYINLASQTSRRYTIASKL